MKLNDFPASMAPQTITVDVLAEKYCKDDEKTEQDLFDRVARALASVEVEGLREYWEQKFLEALNAGFIPGGRICSAAGTGLGATLINCFVQPIGDSISAEQDGHPGIFQAQLEAAETMRRGGGVGYDFSRLRPRGAHVKGTDSRSSGPVSYMRSFDAMCATVESAGARRGAQMAVMRVDHPDVFEFIHAKRDGSLTNFNMSVAVTDDFMAAVRSGGSWNLVHTAAPGKDLKTQGAHQRADGLWVYRSVDAKELWDQIMRSTYDHAEPGVIFIDHVNQKNNLGYVERIAACNPCAEQYLPPYGCCDLGSIDLTRFVEDAFGARPAFNYDKLVQVVAVAVRMLDNVLDLTVWPLPKQREEAHSKRRIGLGFTGLGDALAMLGIRYDSQPGRECAAQIAQTMRDAAYEASARLASEKGAFPLFDAERYLAAPRFASMLAPDLQARIREHGIRNSHLLSIAPTGTISLAFADNASNGIEPAFNWSYTRKKRQADGSVLAYQVEDHAYRAFRYHHGLSADVELVTYDSSCASRVAPGDVFMRAGKRIAMLPQSFVTALEMSAQDHVLMVAAVQPFIDSAISKTVNVPEDYAFEEFENLYLLAWQHGLKGITTYRPNSVIGAVLEESPGQPKQDETPHDLDLRGADGRIVLDTLPKPPVASLRWPGRPRLPNGNPAWAYTVEHPLGDFALFVGHIANGRDWPFEVWVNGSEQPRGLGAIAKTLSMDMRTSDRKWLHTKLEALEKASGDDAFDLAMPPEGRVIRVPSLVSGFARLVRHRCAELGAFDDLDGAPSPVMDALIGKHEPKAGPDGTMSWTVDVRNHATGDDCVLFVKELVVPGGQRRPYSVWLSGEYPRALDGLCKLLSFDMRVIDVAWIGLKLRKLLNYGEPGGAFMTRVPGAERAETYPSTIAYLARLLIHRYAMLGLLSEDGAPLKDTGILAAPTVAKGDRPVVAAKGKKCPECGALAMHRRDGCEVCDACGAMGGCG